jgi:transcriptional regulator with XRE-family HTH domain
MAGPAPIGLLDRQNVAQWARTDHEGQAMPIGERIKELRGKHRWSQADLATKIGGADAGQISRYENGHIAPSADAIVRLAEALDVSCDYLLLVDDAPRRPFRAPEHVLGEHLAGFDELTDEDLHALYMLDALVANNRVKAALTNRAG